MKKWLILGFSMLYNLFAAAQNDAVLRAALYLSGADTAEEVTADWVEAVEHAGRVMINSPRLRSGVLLSAYQVASIREYRRFHGDILSAGELALVDGFSAETVAALRPFLRFDSPRLPGKADTVRVRSTVLLRGTLKNGGIKARTEGEHWRAGAVLRHNWGGKGRDLAWGVHGEWTGSRMRLVAGDFHIRYGLGLASWSGFMLTSLSTTEAFLPRAGGVSPAWSYSPGYRGGAVEYRIGRSWNTSAYASVDGRAGGRVEWVGRHVEAGLGAHYGKGWTFSGDLRWTWKGLRLGTEAAWHGQAFAGKAACLVKVSEVLDLAFQGRVVPSRFADRKNGEYALAAGLKAVWPGNRLSFTAEGTLLPIPDVDPGRRQLKAYGTWQRQFGAWWTLDVRISGRYRNYDYARTDLRADLKYNGTVWLGTARMEAVRCEHWGFLGYLEGGYKGVLNAYLRATVFSIPKWNDRIYVYERDAAGTFSVPAYYGEGAGVSAVAAWKHRFKGRFSLKANLRAAGLFRLRQQAGYTLNVQLQADF